MKQVYSFFIVCLTLAMVTGCWNKNVEESQLVVINVLDPEYYQDCHIEGSINIPFDQFEAKISQLNKNNKYVIYCSNYACTAAPFSASMLVEHGFKDVGVLPGGIVDWYQKGYPVVGACQKTYLKEENEEFGEHDGNSVAIISADVLHQSMIDAKLI